MPKVATSAYHDPGGMSSGTNMRDYSAGHVVLLCLKECAFRVHHCCRSSSRKAASTTYPTTARLRRSTPQPSEARGRLS